MKPACPSSIFALGGAIALFAATALAAPRPPTNTKIDGLSPSTSRTLASTATPAITTTCAGAARVWAVMRQGPWPSDVAPSSLFTDGRSAVYQSEVRVPLSGDGSGAWTGTLPATGAGTVFWSIRAEDENGEAATTSQYQYIVTNAVTHLPQVRKPDFSKFTALGTTRADQVDTGATGAWRFRHSAMFAGGRKSVELFGMPAPNESGEYANDAQDYSFMRTRSAIDGAGYLWFKVRYPWDPENWESDLSSFTSWSSLTEEELAEQYTKCLKATILVETSTSANYRNANLHDIVETIEVPANSSEWIQCRVPLNFSNSQYVRIRYLTNFRYISNASDNNSFSRNHHVEISDIVITPLSPDVVVTKDDLDYSPGYPSIDDPVSFRVHVTNKWDSAPATHFTPKLVWRQDGGAWTETPMTNVLGWAETGDGTYACTLANLPAGRLEYFHRVDFAGYSAAWSHESALESNGGLAVSTGTSNIADFGKWLWADPATNLVSESRCPAYGPDFIDNYDRGGHVAYQKYAESLDDESHLFNIYGAGEEGVFWPQAVRDGTYPVDDTSIYDSNPQALAFTYRALQASEGVRRFRSSYDTVTIVPIDNLAESGGSGLESSYAMQHVGDYTWQAIIRVTNTFSRADGAIDVNMSVRSTKSWTAPDGEASNWTAAYGDGTATGGAFEWGQINQSLSAIHPPMAGAITRTDLAELGDEDEIAPVHTDLTYDGFLMFRFCTTNGAYQIRRAAWQDFNDWQADDLRYSETLGLYGTTLYHVVDSNLQTTAFAWGNFTGFENTTATNGDDDDMIDSIGVVTGNVLARNAWVMADQTTFVTTNLNAAHNSVLRLSGARTYPGSFETTSAADMHSLDTFTMRVRSSSDDDRAAIFTDAASPKDNYRIVAYVRDAGTKSEAGASVSAIGYWRDEGNYWEARLSESRVRRLNNGRPQDQLTPILELSVVEDGVRTILRRSAVTNSSNGTIAAGRAVVLQLTTSGGQVAATAKSLSLVNASNPGNGSSNVLVPGGATVLNITRATSITNGFAGVNARDTSAGIVPYLYPDYTTAGGTFIQYQVTTKGFTGTGADAYQAITKTAAESSWNLAKRREWGFKSPWECSLVTPGATPVMDSNPVVLRRPVPKVHYRVMAYRTGEDDSGMYLAPAMAPSDPWDEAWDSQTEHLWDAVQTVESFSWVTNSFPLHFWDDAFLRVQVCADDDGTLSAGHLVVDDFSCDEWHGQEEYDDNVSYDASELETEAWHGHNAAIMQPRVIDNPRFELDLTRAPTVENSTTPDLYLETPYMTTGLGQISFRWEWPASTDARANWPVAFEVQRVSENSSSYETLGVYTAGVDRIAAYDTIRVAALTNLQGRLRIQPMPYVDAGGTNRLGRILLTDLDASDYPADNSDNAWQAYNVRVSTLTDSEANRRAKFDGYSSLFDSYRTAVLNDAPARDTQPDGWSYDAHLPYLQTPAIATGVGEISFWYRAWPGNGESTASLKLMVATRGDSPYDDRWEELTVDKLEPTNPSYAQQVAALQALASIPTNTWTYFNAEFFEEDYPFMRIVNATTNGANRVMIDNILVTEPVRTAIDIGAISFVPDIPLSSGPVHARVAFVNPRMEPVITNAVLAYYVGTNEWGYAAWKDHPTGTLQLKQSARDEYLYETVDPIPQQPIDQVVQYCAIVDYAGTGARRRTSAEQGKIDNGFWFENPEWYEPVDLNEDFGTSDDPVAHYWVFSVPTNCVFLNEILGQSSRGDVATFTSNQFVEVIGPVGGSLAGWTLEIPDVDMDHDYMPILGSTRYVNVVPSDTNSVFKADPSDTSEKGWGFWVFGAPGVANRNQALFSDEISQSVVDGTADPGEWYWTLYTPGALVLKRSMGAYVDRVYWTANANDDMGDFISAGYRYLANRTKRNNNILHWTDQGDGLTWLSETASIKTPGTYNFGQQESIWKAPVLSGGGEGGGGGGDDPGPGPGPNPDDPVDPTLKPDILVKVVGYGYEQGEGTSTIRRKKITVSVSVTNGVALASTDFDWYVEEFESMEQLAAGTPARSTQIEENTQTGSQIPVMAAGTSEATFDFVFRLSSFTPSTVRFYRVRAVPTWSTGEDGE